MAKYSKLKNFHKKGIFKHMGAYLSNFLKLVEDLEPVKSFRKAGGFKAIVMAFQGKSAKEIELDAIYRNAYKEESIKARIHEEYRANHSLEREEA